MSEGSKERAVPLTSNLAVVTQLHLPGTAGRLGQHGSVGRIFGARHRDPDESSQRFLSNASETSGRKDGQEGIASQLSGMISP